MSVDACRLIDLPRISDHRGYLTYVEGIHHVPFDIRRVYYLYGVPAGAERGGHAHKKLQQVIIAISGSFQIVLDDGITRRRFELSEPHRGLYICPMIWREIDNFSDGAVCMVLASEKYEESDYHRDYAQFAAAAVKSKYE